MLGSAADTCTTSVYGGFEEGHTFPTCRWTSRSPPRCDHHVSDSLVACIDEGQHLGPVSLPVSGLFAVGEVDAGVHGNIRLGGHTLWIVRFSAAIRSTTASCAHLLARGARWCADMSMWELRFAFRGLVLCSGALLMLVSRRRKWYGLLEGFRGAPAEARHEAWP